MMMRNFDDIRRELSLIRFAPSDNGNQYVTPATCIQPVLVRHFDRALEPALIGPYARLLADAQAWIERDPALSALVRVEQPIELGRDFLSRRFISATSLGAFLNTDPDDDPPEAPDELAPMQARFHECAARAVTPEDARLAAILARSILEPTYKTMYSPREELFIVADLKPTRSELTQLTPRDP
jgi:hypothetical protein